MAKKSATSNEEPESTKPTLEDRVAYLEQCTGFSLEKKLRDSE